MDKQTAMEREIERINASGEAWQETDEVVEVEISKPLNRVIPVRLPADAWERLRQEAKDLGIGPTTLARMWLLERLKKTVAQR